MTAGSPECSVLSIDAGAPADHVNVLDVGIDALQPDVVGKFVLHDASHNDNRRILYGAIPPRIRGADTGKLVILGKHLGEEPVSIIEVKDNADARFAVHDFPHDDSPG